MNTKTLLLSSFTSLLRARQGTLVTDMSDMLWHSNDPYFDYGLYL